MLTLIQNDIQPLKEMSLNYLHHFLSEFCQLDVVYCLEILDSEFCVRPKIIYQYAVKLIFEHSCLQRL